jgi:hypothetical protein
VVSSTEALVDLDEALPEFLEGALGTALPGVRFLAGEAFFWGFGMEMNCAGS